MIGEPWYRQDLPKSYYQTHNKPPPLWIVPSLPINWKGYAFHFGMIAFMLVSANLTDNFPGLFNARPWILPLMAVYVFVIWLKTDRSPHP